MSEPRTHYQISLTARQAVGAFAALLGALGLAYFFGLMTGLAGREPGAPEMDALAGATGRAAAPTAASEPAVPPVETGIPLAARGPDAVVTRPPAEPTTPATLRPFDDASEEESATAEAAPSRTSVVGAPAPAPKAASSGKAASASGSAATGAGRVWVQAASLSSREEAGALGVRLSKRGFHVVISPGTGPKGTVYRVRVGPYHSEEEASRAVAKLSKQERIREPWIVPDGK